MKGFSYLKSGACIAFKPGIRVFTALPLLVNALLFGSLFVVGYEWVNDWEQQLIASVPSWLAWLNWLIAPLFLLAAALFLFYCFSLFANLIASPFNGLLAEVVESHLNPNASFPDTSLSALATSIPRSLKREFQKIAYFLPRVLLVWLLGFFIPGLNVLLWFLLSAWMMALQYFDYPIDNHQRPFRDVKMFTRGHTNDSLSFGSAVMLMTMIPLINLFIMPIAVCAATKFWVDHPTPDKA